MAAVLQHTLALARSAMNGRALSISDSSLWITRADWLVHMSTSMNTRAVSRFPEPASTDSSGRTLTISEAPPFRWPTAETETHTVVAGTLMRLDASADAAMECVSM